MAHTSAQQAPLKTHSHCPPSRLPDRRRDGVFFRAFNSPRICSDLPAGDRGFRTSANHVNAPSRFQQARRGFRCRRVTHGTWLLDQGTPVHVVAKRLGHDPCAHGTGVLLRTYAKRTRRSDNDAAEKVSQLTKGNRLGQPGAKVLKMVATIFR